MTTYPIELDLHRDASELLGVLLGVVGPPDGTTPAAGTVVAERRA